MIIRSLNPQINNFPIKSTIVKDILGGAQCGYTSFCCALSERTNNDKYVLYLGSRMENTTELRMYILRSMGLKEAGQRLGAYGQAYYYAAKYLNETGELKNESIFIKGNGTVERVKNLIDNGFAFLLSTMLVPSGHFITVVGYTEDCFICIDPAGAYSFTQPNNGYFSDKGHNVHYNIEAHREHFMPKIEPYNGGLRGTAIKEV